MGLGAAVGSDCDVGTEGGSSAGLEAEVEVVTVGCGRGAKVEGSES